MTGHHRSTGQDGDLTAPEQLTALVEQVRPVRVARSFVQGPARVALRTDHSTLLDAVTSALYAYTTSCEDGRWTVVAHTDARVHHSLANAAFAHGTDLDIGPYQLTACSIPTRRGRAYWIPGGRTLVLVDTGQRSVTVYCPHPNVAQVMTIRVVRQLMTGQLLEHGAVYLHAAAFTHSGHGVLVAGGRGAGKTTTLLTALRLIGGDFVANDRLLIAPAADAGHRDAHAAATATVGYAWPAPLRATAATLQAIPDLAALLPEPPSGRPSTGPDTPPDKIEISAHELRQLLPAARLVGELHPTVMLWPYRAARDTTPQPVPADEVREVLARTQCFLHDPVTGITSHRNHWLVHHPDDTDRSDGSGAADHADNPATRARIADLLTAAVPAVRVAVTDSPHELAGRLAALLAPDASPLGPAGGAR